MRICTWWRKLKRGKPIDNDIVIEPVANSAIERGPTETHRRELSREFRVIDGEGFVWQEMHAGVTVDMTKPFPKGIDLEEYARGCLRAQLATMLSRSMEMAYIDEEGGFRKYVGIVFVGERKPL